MPFSDNRNGFLMPGFVLRELTKKTISIQTKDGVDSDAVFLLPISMKRPITRE